MHLIQYQHLREYGLKTIVTSLNNTCTLYEIDFMFQEGMNVDFTNETSQRLLERTATESDYVIACDYISSMNRRRYETWTEDFKTEDNAENDINKLSGIDVLEEIEGDGVGSPYKVWDRSSEHCQNSAGENNLIGDVYKYVCIDLTSDIPEQRKGYKEVTYVNPFHVVMVRIRWAKSHMTNEEFRAAHETGE